MNKVILMGRLTKDPDGRYSQGENSMIVCKYTLAVERRFNQKNDTSADFINKNGTKVYTTDIVIEEQDFAESKNQTKNNPNTNTNQSIQDGFVNIPDTIDDELPFH